MRRYRTEDWVWELLLDAATLKNIILTFPRRSLLGNTDTERGSLVRKEYHGTMGNPVTMLKYGSGTQWSYCWDYVRVSTVGCEVQRMLCRLCQ